MPKKTYHQYGYRMLSIYLTPEVYDGLRQFAKDHNTNMNALIKTYIAALLAPTTADDVTGTPDGVGDAVQATA